MIKSMISASVGSRDLRGKCRVTTASMWCPAASKGSAARLPRMNNVMNLPCLPLEPLVCSMGREIDDNFIGELSVPETGQHLRFSGRMRKILEPDQVGTAIFQQDITGMARSCAQEDEHQLCSKSGDES